MTEFLLARKRKRLNEFIASIKRSLYIALGLTVNLSETDRFNTP